MHISCVTVGSTDFSVAVGSSVSTGVGSTIPSVGPGCTDDGNGPLDSCGVTVTIDSDSAGDGAIVTGSVMILEDVPVYL